MRPRLTRLLLRYRASPSQSPLRALLVMVLLLTVALSAWGVFIAHQVRVRGIPRDFPAPVNDANVFPLGVNVALDRYSEPELEAVLSRIDEAGFVWVRQTFAWSQVGDQGGSGRLDWSLSDAVIEGLRQYPRLRLIAVLEDDPPVPPEDPDTFAAFAGAFAARYGDVVDHYQIWDEPNLADHWGGGPVNPSAYADLLARTARAIEATDPYARILLAGLAPTSETGPQNLNEVRYLQRLYQAGAARAFDIVAAKPYGFDTGPHDRRVDASVLNVSRVLLLREVMVRNGDGNKAIWATQWGWNALPNDWDGAPSVWGLTDEHTQAARSVATLERAREEWPWMGGMIIENLQPEVSPSTASRRDLENPRWGFSLLAPDGTTRPVYNALGDWVQSLPSAAGVGGYAADNRWATYQGAWRVGPVGAAVGSRDAPDDAGASELSPGGSRATFRFDGTRVALTVRRGPYRAFLYVTVDGKPASALPRDEQGQAYIVLYDKESRLETVPLAKGLEPGPHTVELVAEGGEDQWSLIDWRVGAARVGDGTIWKLGVLVVAAVVLTVVAAGEIRSVRWSHLAAIFLDLPSRAQTGWTVVLTAAFWATAASSWGRPTSYETVTVASLIASLLLLPVLAFLFALRLDLGLGLVALTAPFYLVPETMLYWALSVPEILVLLCVVATGARRIAESRGVCLPWRPRWTDSQAVKRPKPERSALDGAVLVWILAAVLSSLAAEDHLAALFELRSVFLIPGLYYALLRLVPMEVATRRRIVDCFLIGGFGVALVGLGQFALGRNLVPAEGGLPRLQSVYHSPNSVGLYLGRVWPFLLVGSGLGRDRGRRLLFALALAVVTLALVLSFSRGALLLALPASIIVIGWRAGGRYRWLALGLVGLGTVALIPLLRLPRFAALFDLGRGTTFFRLKLWRSSVTMIREHPLSGVGPGNFLHAYRTRYVLPAGWEEFDLEHAHNLLLDHWTRLGLLGVAAGLAVQLGFWRVLNRRRRDVLALGLAGSMGALLAHGFVDNAVFFPDLALAFFLLLAMAQEEA